MKRSGSLLVIAGLMALTPSLQAQSAGTGALTGTVSDPAGGVVPGATVTLTSTDTNQARTATTGAEGSYKFSLLPPGTYKVRFSATGFKTSEVSSVTVNVTETPRAVEQFRPAHRVCVPGDEQVGGAGRSGYLL